MNSGRARIFLLVMLSVVAGGCAAAMPGDRSGAAADHSWIQSPGLFERFDVQTREISPLNAYLLALAVRAGDMNTSMQRKTLSTWGFDGFSPVIDRDASVYAYVASNPEMVLVVFSGTDIRNIRDLESDADALYPVRRERYSAAGDALAHRGFARDLDAVWDAITDEVKSHAGGGGAEAAKPVWIAGHSRGGAFATLAAAAWAQDRNIDVAGLYTYGQPRVGNAAFARALDALNITYCRVINEHDLVPAIPARIGEFGADYAHAGTVAHLAAGPSLRKDPPADSLRLFVVDPDHYMDGYLQKLYTVVTESRRIEDPQWAMQLQSRTSATTTASTSPATPSLPRPPG